MTLEEALAAALEPAIRRAVTDAVAELDLTPTDRPLTVTVDQAAELLAVSPATVRRMARTGRLPTIDTGTDRIVIPRAGLDRLIAAALAAVMEEEGSAPALRLAR